MPLGTRLPIIAANMDYLKVLHFSGDEYSALGLKIMERMLRVRFPSRSYHYRFCSQARLRKHARRCWPPGRGLGRHTLEAAAGTSPTINRRQPPPTARPTPSPAPTSENLSSPSLSLPSGSSASAPARAAAASLLSCGVTNSIRTDQASPTPGRAEPRASPPPASVSAKASRRAKKHALRPAARRPCRVKRRMLCPGLRIARPARRPSRSTRA